MSGDRELLELAAKAAGIEGTWFAGYLATHPGHFGVNISPAGHDVWDPLNDDGEALRLAVKLQLSIRIDSIGTAARQNDGDEWQGVMSNPDPAVATRRAIVRAAAEIGKAMP